MTAAAETAVPVQRHRWTVDDFHRMVEHGVIGENDRIELLDGELYEMTPIGSRHAAATDFLLRALDRAVGDAAVVRCQSPIRLGDLSEPQPDLALLRPRPDWYRDAHPSPGDVLLVIEVADRSLAYDRDLKLPAYARAGIPEAWLIALNDGRLEIHRNPAPDGYRRIERMPLDEAEAVPLPVGETSVDLRPLA
ncbi:MAG TPA: Uma2 family endonuclease [Chromatiales bacterium]|nr:Uma2 family endonuclease [Chromatiales bacterium]